VKNLLAFPGADIQGETLFVVEAELVALVILHLFIQIERAHPAQRVASLLGVFDVDDFCSHEG